MATKRGAAGQSKKRKPTNRAAVRQLANRGSPTDTSPCAKARLILTYGHDSAEALFKAFEIVRSSRGVGPGTTTDEEQDLLRAMLVMAAAGLDSMIKQVIRDTLPTLIDSDGAVRTAFENFVAKQIRGDAGSSEGIMGHKWLAKVLVAESYRTALIEQYVIHLTGSSLQSADELYKASKALGLDPQGVGVDAGALRPIFKARNEIIHELDINFGHPNRNRQSRSRTTMLRHTNVLLELGVRILEGVESQLSSP